jgi:hypothetical protein
MLSYMRKKLRPLLQVESNIINTNVAGVLDMFGRAEKFLLPQDGLLFEDTDASHFAKFFRLPFPTIVLEYKGTTGLYGQKPRDNYEAVNVVMLAKEGRLESIKDRMVPGEQADGAIICVAYSQQADPKKWLLMPSAVFVRYGTELQQYAADLDNVAVGLLYPGIVEPEDERDFTICTNAVIKESLALFHFCSALNCSNVTYDKIAAPKFINAKRKAKGELPLYEYKILTVDTRARHVDTGEALPTGRKHASPRQHIRRGHIRHYKSGKNVWVQQMTVGDPAKGRIDKDYVVRR